MVRTLWLLTNYFFLAARIQGDYLDGKGPSGRAAFVDVGLLMQVSDAKGCYLLHTFNTTPSIRMRRAAAQFLSTVGS